MLPSILRSGLISFWFKIISIFSFVMQSSCIASNTSSGIGERKNLIVYLNNGSNNMLCIAPFVSPPCRAFMIVPLPPRPTAATLHSHNTHFLETTVDCSYHSYHNVKTSHFWNNLIMASKTLRVPS